MVAAIVHQLTRNLKDSQIQDSAFVPYFVDHTVGVYPTAASGFPWTAASMQVKGDPMADLTEDLAADATTTKEQPAFSKARKPLVLLDFRHFQVFHRNGIPATI
jgi:spore coat protein JC